MRCDLGGRVAFVTGAAGAIGSVIAARLAANGTGVVAADIKRDGAERIAATLLQLAPQGVLTNAIILLCVDGGWSAGHGRHF